MIVNHYQQHNSAQANITAAVNTSFARWRHVIVAGGRTVSVHTLAYLEFYKGRPSSTTNPVRAPGR